MIGQDPQQSMSADERLYGYEHAFDHPVTVWLTIAGVGLLALVPLVLLAIRPKPELRRELWKRYLSWLVLAPLIVVPLLLGAFWTIGAFLILSLMTCREFARATGLFRARAISTVLIVGIVTTFLSILDHWYGLFMALSPLTVGAVCVVGVLADEPKGYVQRAALGIFAFMICGIGLGHMAYLANDANYRPLVFLLIFAIEMNDVFAYVCGKTFGRRKLAPNTSPNKTLGGSIGALVLTTAFVSLVAAPIFVGTPLDDWSLLIGLGLIVSMLGQLGDLTLSSIKRDVGIKDMGKLIPGHGGLLDRFDSMLLVAPAVFHYIGYYVGIGLDQKARVFTDG